MSKLYIFAIGGSGARVLRSLTMLLASGVEVKGVETIIPIIIDPDQANGDQTRTIKLVQEYESIRKLAYIPGKHTPFFDMPLEALPGSPYRIELKHVAGQKFGDYIEYPSLSKASRALTSLLYSDDYRGLKLDMEIGFQGNPNIGSVVLGQFVDTPAYQAFVNDFKEGDRIFVISSIFGGTGASGFPTLLKSLRDPDQTPNQLVQKAKIGALSILPYFDLEIDADSVISSDTFIAKTKAAMHYYRQSVIVSGGVDALYYIGIDPSFVGKQQNNAGGDGQKNKAHQIELWGALSALHFAGLSEDANSPVVYEYGALDPAKDFDSLSDSIRKQIASPLTSFWLVHKLLEHETLTGSRHQALRMAQEKQALSPDFEPKLKKFAENYREWLEELGENAPTFSPIRLDQVDSELFDCVEGRPVELGFLERRIEKQNYNLFIDTLNRMKDGVDFAQNKAEFNILELLGKATEDLCINKIKL